MEATNALGLKPLCALPEKRLKPSKTLSISSIKFSDSSPNRQHIKHALSKFFQGSSSLAFFQSLINPHPGFALTYDEALMQSVTGSSSANEFDTTGFLDGIVSFIIENPLVIGGGIAIVAVPLIVSQLLAGGKPKGYGVESAKSVYTKLGDDLSAQLVDIRSLKEIKEVGSPDLKGWNKKAVSIVYQSGNNPGFLQKLALKFKEPENITLYILDKFDGNSEIVAELVAANGFKAAYAIKDGAEGSRGWMNSGLPWLLPKKSFSFDFASLTESITGSAPDSSDALPLTIGVAAATGLGLLAFTEIETILQLLGSAAIIQVIGKKLLFAEERKRTLQQVDEFLNTKVAPKELVSDVKQIGIALLPLSVNTKALPAPTEPSSSVVEKPDTVSEVKSEVKIEGSVQPTPMLNSVPQTESNAALPRPLSPYISYPDLKPPSSPSPSAPTVPSPAIAEKPDPVSEVKSEAKIESLQATPMINSVPQVEPNTESNGALPRPLSPFISYPDLKPPSSPSPSAPTVPSPTIAEKPDPVSEVKSEAKIESVQATPMINSVPQVAPKTESNGALPRPLSPYISYPDLKPPSSPCPSQP